MDAAISHLVGVFGRAPDILVNNLGLADPIPFESYPSRVEGRRL